MTRHCCELFAVCRKKKNCFKSNMKILNLTLTSGEHTLKSPSIMHSRVIVCPRSFTSLALKWIKKGRHKLFQQKNKMKQEFKTLLSIILTSIVRVSTIRKKKKKKPARTSETVKKKIKYNESKNKRKKQFSYIKKKNKNWI